DAYALGPASARPYLDLAVLERALVESRVDAVWVGWGFVAEDPTFVDLCDRLGVVFIGPTADSMRRLGDKIGSKLIAEEVGVPVAPWSRGALDTLPDALAAAERIGYPVMLKATAGGGGRGIRKAASAAELEDVYQRTRDEAERAFGNGTVFLESMVSGARHVEVQVIADGHGTAWALGVRDCSIQRRNQKVIEESSSPLLAADQVALLKESAERLALAVGYRGAGTVEFLYHPGSGELAFLEVNTRLQVEHTITEITTDVDLVRAQLHVAAGGRLEGEKPVEKGHAVEARLNAEDPDRDFAPAPGRIALLEFPTGPGVRVDTGVGEGDVIPPDFDSMIAKVVAFGPTRAEALARLRRALHETTVVIEGGATNKSFILELLDQPEVVTGEGGWADTAWIDRVRAEGRLVAHEHSGVALVAAGIEAYEAQLRLEVAHLIESAHGGRPQARHVVGRPIDLELRGTTYRVTTLKTGDHRYRVTVAPGDRAQGDDAVEQTVEVAIERINDFHARLVVNGKRFAIVTATHGPVQLVEVDGVTHRVGHDEGGVLRSPSPALVVATPVGVGDLVEEGAPVIVLESMKMETVLRASFAARVTELHVTTGSQVETGSALVRLEAVEEGQEAAGSAPEEETVGLDLPTADDRATAVVRAERARSLLAAAMLGFDAPDADRALAAYVEARGELADAGTRELTEEIALLGVFADVAELSRNRPAAEEQHSELRVHSSREHFHTYLQSLDVDRGGLPEHFSDRLRTVLAHYGVADLERTPELEEAVFRIFLAQRSADTQVVITLLQLWSEEPPPDDDLAAQVRGVLERLVRATQLRSPVIGDVARSVRFRWFDQPLVDRERSAVIAGVRDEVAALAAHPDAPDHTERVDALAAIPEQIVTFLAERLEHGIPEHEPMLEVLVKRHYRDFALHDLRSVTGRGRPFVVADYALNDRPTHLVSTIGTFAELAPDAGLVADLVEQVAARPSGHDAVVDLYLSWPEAPGSPDSASAELAAAIGSLPFAPDVRRIAVAVCTPGRPVDYFTFRPSADGVEEDALVRGMHPMVGRRLDLWRLRDFEVKRLEAPDDVLLYECVARENPADRRLVALAQVRQMAVVRDESGAVVAVPHAERAIENCFEAIRRVRTSRGSSGTKLDTNHVWVHVWPLVTAEVGQLTALQGKITPLSEGVGIEEVTASGRVLGPDGEPVPIVLRFAARPGAGVVSSVEEPATEPLRPLDDYATKVLRARRRGLVYPYELLGVLTGAGGSCVEHDLDESGQLVPVERPFGLNTAGILVGVISTPTPLHPEGVTRVVLCGDPTMALGAVSEPECTRIIAAIDLAERMQVPVEWVALSAGARISMASGTENMDWVAEALRRIVEFTQAGGEINVVVAGINVGAQPYWNAEATMLMHTRGVLVMTPDSAMVLTGKQTLDFSGGVSAEDNYGIGGYDRVMGPNGQAQYWAKDLAGSFEVLMAHYEHTYVVPGEAAPRSRATNDPADRDITTYPHDVVGSDFRTVGEIFAAETNKDRKKAFDIRTVMRALSDQDHPVLERWAGMADAETAVAQDVRIGGHPVALLGIESRPVPRRGFPPTDGPDIYTAGTLFPRSSKKAARAINAASGNRPLVVLANLSGFDGSPDSMRNLQLEYGAEIGRAIVNFRGPIVFVVLSRYHGGAFVVFSKRLNPEMTVLAVDGSFASVIGGAPAAAVVFAGEVQKRTAAHPAIQALESRVAESSGNERAAALVELSELRVSVRGETISKVAAEFDGIHDIRRAVEVGSVDAIIDPARMRPEIIAVIERTRGSST
ncbi:MAG: ATP-grasp protein, partial [Nocardioidaceae bacterium]|nr:ATP-grasp protein [Nocardioidaceae bacterium]